MHLRKKTKIWLNGSMTSYGGTHLCIEGLVPIVALRNCVRLLQRCDFLYKGGTMNTRLVKNVRLYSRVLLWQAVLATLR